MRASRSGNAASPTRTRCYAMRIPPPYRSCPRGRRLWSFLCSQRTPGRCCRTPGCDTHETVLIVPPERAAARYSPSQTQKERAMQSESKAFKHQIPSLMAAARAALGPVIVIGERAGWSGLTLATMVVTALLSDIYDGVLARRWKCDTAAVRLFDSMADNVFYVGAAVALWMRQPQLMRSFEAPIGIVLGIEVFKFVFDFVKFGKPSSYHSYLAKTWGLVLATTVVMSFALHVTLGLRVAWWVALALGMVTCLEGLAMSVIMPEWRHDLKTLWRALALRRRILLH